MGTHTRPDVKWSKPRSQRAALAILMLVLPHLRRFQAGASKASTAPKRKFGVPVDPFIGLGFAGYFGLSFVF